MYDKVIINMGDFNFAYDFVKKNETEEEAIKRAESYYQKNMLETWQNEINYPDNEHIKKASDKAWNLACEEVKVFDFDEWLKLKKNNLLNVNNDLKEITDEDFNDMLNVLPPLKWCTIDGVEMFCMSEMYDGTITLQYARHNGKYYSMLVDCADRETWINKKLIA